MTRHLGLVLIPAVLAAGCVSPDKGEWTSVGLGGGGGIFCAAASPHDPNWTKLDIEWPADGPSWVHAKYPSIDPYNPDRVWLSTGTHGTFVTTNAGKTWHRMPGIPFRGVNRITVDPEDHEVIWASTFGGGVWRGPALPKSLRR